MLQLLGHHRYNNQVIITRNLLIRLIIHIKQKKPDKSKQKFIAIIKSNQMNDDKQILSTKPSIKDYNSYSYINQVGISS
jgi:hypothetical protein